MKAKAYIVNRAMAEQPAQQQEPVATGKQFLQVDELLKDMLETLPYNSPDYWIGRIKEVMPLYTSPQPSKPWVGLTDEETKACFDSVPTQDCQSYEHWRSLVAKAIEDKLCQKNT